MFRSSTPPQGRCSLSSDILRVHALAGVIAQRLSMCTVFNTSRNTRPVLPGLCLSTTNGPDAKPQDLFQVHKSFQMHPVLRYCRLRHPLDRLAWEQVQICLATVSLGPVH